MSVKFLICTAMLCVGGVKAETEVWEGLAPTDRELSKSTSDQTTAEVTAEPPKTSTADGIPAGFTQVVIKVPIQGEIKGTDFTKALVSGKALVKDGVQQSLAKALGYSSSSRRQAGTTEGTVSVTDVAATGTDGLKYTAEVTLKKLLEEGVDTTDTAALTESLLGELRASTNNVASMDLSAVVAAVKQVTGEDVVLTATAPTIDESKASLELIRSQATTEPVTGSVTRDDTDLTGIIVPSIIGGVLVIAGVVVAAVLVARARSSEGTGQRGVYVNPEPTAQPPTTV